MWSHLLLLLIVLTVLSMTIVTYMQVRDTHTRLTTFQTEWEQSLIKIESQKLNEQTQRAANTKQFENKIELVESKLGDRLNNLNATISESWFSKKIDEILDWTRSKKTPPKHVVNYEPFERLCITASLNPDVLDTFRRTPELIDMLEHVPEYNGPDFLKVIQIVADEARVEIPWDTVALNDQVGSPQISTYVWKDTTISICPTTLRYVMLSLQSLIQIKNMYRDGQVSMIEIGAGYGGQCAMFFKLAPLIGVEITSYTILDLDGPRALQRAYLTTQLTEAELDRMQFLNVSNPSIRTLLNPKSFLFSAYAYSEIHEDVQRLYNATLQGFPSHGRIVWNSVDLPECGFFRMVGLEAWQISIQPEFPKTSVHNMVYVF